MLSLVFFISAIASLSSASAIGDACAGSSYDCGLSPKNDGTAAILQCIGGSFQLLDNCDDTPNNACSIIGGNPYCVAGTGLVAGNGQTPAPATPAPIIEPVVPVATAPVGNPSTASSTCAGTSYAVQDGDLCDTIASNHGATVGDLVVLNQDVCGGENQNKLQVGQAVCIVPGAAADVGPTILADAVNTAAYLATSACSGHVDLVMTDATCTAIAAKYGISLDALMAATLPEQCQGLEAADAICIPGGVGGAATAAPGSAPLVPGTPATPAAPATPVVAAPATPAGSSVARSLKSQLSGAFCAGGKLAFSYDMTITPPPATEDGLASYVGAFSVNGTPAKISSMQAYVMKPTVSGTGFSFNEEDDQPSVGAQMVLDVACTGDGSLNGVALQFSANPATLPNGSTVNVALEQSTTF
ncbi:hypothetical protein HDU98_004566 [Podochytrium sp. JEL0797]|nr:hypothetical protein HDU98_004566 [Podochytrium sp. JEL0797]